MQLQQTNYVLFVTLRSTTMQIVIISKPIAGIRLPTHQYNIKYEYMTATSQVCHLECGKIV